MYSLTICFGPAATVWTLLFKTEEKARALRDDMAGTGAPGNTVFLMVDDFGQEVGIRADQIHGVMLEDMDQSALAQIERGIHQARVQAKAQDRAMTDPAIANSIRRSQQGPAVMTPFGLNG